MRTILITAVVALCAAVAVPAAAHKGGKHKGHKPDVIALPNGDRGADHERRRDKNRSHGDTGTPSGWTMGTT